MRSIGKDEIEFCVNQIRLNGYTVLENYLQSAQLLDQKIDRLFDFRSERFAELRSYQLPEGVQRKSLQEDDFIHHLPVYDVLFARLSVEGDHQEIIRDILNDKFYGIEPGVIPNYNLGMFNARRGHSALPWHNDVRFQHSSCETFSLQTFFSLEDMDSCNGTLCVVPESHFLGTYPRYPRDFDSCEILGLKSGDLVIFDSRLHHCTIVGNNNLLNIPWTILGTYRSWWLKQNFDYYGYFCDYKNTHPHRFSQSQLAILGGNSHVDMNLHRSVSLRRRAADIE